MQFVGQKNDLKKHVGLLLGWEEGKRYYFFFFNVYKLLVQKKILKCQVKDWFKITW